jgi:hypothetical protein
VYRRKGVKMSREEDLLGKLQKRKKLGSSNTEAYVRIPRETHRRLRDFAEDRDLYINHVGNLAIITFLDAVEGGEKKSPKVTKLPQGTSGADMEPGD